MQEMWEHFHSGVVTMNIEEFIDNNYWLSGKADMDDGDLFSGMETREMMLNPSTVNDLNELYNLLRNFDGSFIYRDFILFKTWKDGTFVYHRSYPKSYVEHLSIDFMSEDGFVNCMKRLEEEFNEPLSD